MFQWRWILIYKAFLQGMYNVWFSLLHFCFNYVVSPPKDPHYLNVDVLALLHNSKCFHVLVVVNPFSLWKCIKL